MNTKKIFSQNSAVALVKEYSGLLLLFPTLVAGCHQFGILVSINANLMHFFSVSSLAKDGILLTFQCVLLFIISYIYRVFIIKYFYKKYKQHLINVNIIATILGFSLLVLSKSWILENYAYIVLFLAMFLVINHGVLLQKDIFSITGIYIGQTFMVLIINSILLQFPNNGIRNIDEVSSKVKVKYPKSELLYYNDEYLFFSTKQYKPNDIKKDILIIKMDEIFISDFKVD